MAAPTAGLHFTPELIRSLKNRGSDFFDLTLRIGIGTFHPIQVEKLEAHTMHKEWYEISKEVVDQLQSASMGPRVAVGTTAVRTIEDVMARAATNPDVYEGCQIIQEEADLFIYPCAISGSGCLNHKFSFAQVDAAVFGCIIFGSRISRRYTMVAGSVCGSDRFKVSFLQLRRCDAHSIIAHADRLHSGIR